MKTLKIIMVLLFFFTVQNAQADLLADDILGSENDEAIIEANYFATQGGEEPNFRSRKVERNVANLNFENTIQEDEWQGQLVVLKEIPYTYPAVSRRTLQLRTLIEIEEKEKAEEIQ